MLSTLVNVAWGKEGERGDDKGKEEGEAKETLPTLQFCLKQDLLTSLLKEEKQNHTHTKKESLLHGKIWTNKGTGKGPEDRDTHVWTHPPLRKADSGEGQDLMSVQETLLPCQFLTTSRCMYLPSQSKSRGTRRGVRGQVKARTLPHLLAYPLLEGGKPLERQCCDPNVHATLRHFSTKTNSLLSLVSYTYNNYLPRKFIPWEVD